MENLCQECKQKAEFICFCTDCFICKGCREIHKKKYKGPHKILISNDPDIEAIRLAYKNRNNPQKETPTPDVPIEKKKIEDPPALVEEKKKIKHILSRDINSLTDFREKTIGSITDQAKSLIQEVIVTYKSATDKFITECDSKGMMLSRALDHLNSSSDISTNLLLCKILDYPDLSNICLLDLKSTIQENIVSLENSLEFSLELMKFEENNQILDYFNQNKDTIAPPIKVLFEDIMNDRHFAKSTIKLVKVPLNKEGAAQLSLILPQFTALKVLQLSENELGLEGIKKLGPIISSCKSIRKLMISKNQLKGPGGKALAPFLKNMPEMLALDLSGNKFGSEGMKPISYSIQTMKKLKSLKIMSNSLGNDSINSIVSFLPNLKKLKTLRISGNSFHAEEQGLIEENAPDGCRVKF